MSRRHTVVIVLALVQGACCLWDDSVEPTDLTVVEPSVFHVTGTADPEQGFNILFLGDGFQEHELPTYQAADEQVAG